ncbi:MAG: hypothetical protein JWN85_126 [Gammaproteobacteria bacterium]|nr:hypothetical protein [Gammaproteobacteria bacterium]
MIPGHAAFTRTDINSQDIWGARAAVTWKPSDSLHVDMSYAAQEVRMSSEAGAQPAFGNYVVQRPLDLYSRGEDMEQERIGQLVIGYDWSAASLTSATSYTRLQRYAAQDIGFLAVAAGFGPQLWPLLDRSKGSAFTQEVRLQSRGDSPFQWLAGYFYTNSSFNLGQYVPDYSCPTCLPTALYGQSFALETVGNDSGEKQKQQSVFGEASYRVASQALVPLCRAVPVAELPRVESLRSMQTQPAPASARSIKVVSASWVISTSLGGTVQQRPRESGTVWRTVPEPN